MTEGNKRKIIDWITCGGQAKPIQEDGDVSEDLTTEEINTFIDECRQVLDNHFGNK
jgi:hypothetical protein